MRAVLPLLQEEVEEEVRAVLPLLQEEVEEEVEEEEVRAAVTFLLQLVQLSVGEAGPARHPPRTARRSRSGRESPRSGIVSHTIKVIKVIQRSFLPQMTATKKLCTQAPSLFTVATSRTPTEGSRSECLNRNPKQYR